MVMQSSGGILDADVGAAPSRRRSSSAVRRPASSAREHVGAQLRLRQHDHPRHGRHHRQGLADRERAQVAYRRRVRGRRRHVGRAAARGRRRLRAQAAGDRHLRGRRRRRQHRLARPGGRAQGRPAAAPAPSRARPATAGAATEPTVTDANVVLGYLNPRRSPAAPCRSTPRLARRAVARADRGAARPRSPRDAPTASTSSPTPT